MERNILYEFDRRKRWRIFLKGRTGDNRRIKYRVRDVNKFILKDLNRSDDSWRVYTYYYYYYYHRLQDVHLYFTRMPRSLRIVDTRSIRESLVVRKFLLKIINNFTFKKGAKKRKPN